MRLDLVDHPGGWKPHAVSTPYLGGAAALAGFLVAAAAFNGNLGRFTPLLLCVTLMFAVGTIDDSASVRPIYRVAVEAAVGILLSLAGLGWSLFPSELLNVLLTMFWVIGIVNALNLLDLMDGVAGTVAAVAAAGTAAVAYALGDTALAVLAISASGACAGFLPYNLSSPSRIFLGDGGTMSIGCVLAAAIMALPAQGPEGAAGAAVLLAGILLFGFPLLDMTSRVISRRRRGVSVMTAGRDSLVNRLESRLASPWSIAATLGMVQAALAVAAVSTAQLESSLLVLAWGAVVAAASLSVIMLERRTWGGTQHELSPMALGSTSPVVPPSQPEQGITPIEVVLVVLIALACGLSPVFYGFYDLSIWGPIALFLLAVLFALLLARPVIPSRAALAAVAGLVGLWGWSLLSTRWAESADQALTEANRWMLYAALLGLLIMLVRNDRIAKLLLGSTTSVVLALGLTLMALMALGSGEGLFAGPRLHEPLGYINGQAGYFLLGFWPLVAVAERAKNPVAAGAALAGTVILASLLLLTQTRAIVPAILVSAGALLLAVPGRKVRAWTLVAVTGATAAAAGPVLDVYSTAVADGGVSDPELRRAALTTLVAAVAAGTLWAGIRAALLRLAESRPSSQTFLSSASSVGLVAVACAILIAGLSSLGDPVAKVRSEYRAFTTLSGDEQSGSRFASGSGNRYDYWRIGVNQFSQDPLKGVGAGNYDTSYFRERRNPESIRQPHSIEVQTLAELGLVGLVALGAFLGAVFLGSARWVRETRTAGRDPVLLVAAGGTALAWLAHTSVDWLHLIPGVTGIALCSAAVLLLPQGGVRPALARTAWRKVVVATAALLVFIAAINLGRSTLAEHYREQGTAAVAANPVHALDQAARSLALNGESLDSYYLRAAAHARLGDYRAARGALRDAAAREPHDFVPWALLGDLAVRRGDFPQAARDYTHALMLNPRDITLRHLARDPRSALQ